jgi:hypothetical protein
MRYAIVNPDKKVVNVIEAPEGWELDDDSLTLVPSDDAGPNDAYNGRTKKFTPEVRDAPGKSLQKKYDEAATAEDRTKVLAEALGIEPR